MSYEVHVVAIERPGVPDGLIAILQNMNDVDARRAAYKYNEWICRDFPGEFRIKVGTCDGHIMAKTAVANTQRAMSSVKWI